MPTVRWRMTVTFGNYSGKYVSVHQFYFQFPEWNSHSGTYCTFLWKLATFSSFFLVQLASIMSWSYTGQVMDNLPHGTGTKSSSDNKTIHSGRWKQGVPHGPGVKYRACGKYWCHVQSENWNEVFSHSAFKPKFERLSIHRHLAGWNAWRYAKFAQIPIHKKRLSVRHLVCWHNFL